jgi:acylphosphatase
MEPTFEKLLALLADGNVAFVLVGGVAVTLHGYVRLTEDVDILIEPSTENVERLIATLSTYGEGFAGELSVENFTDEEGAIRVVEETEMSQIDIFTRMSGLRYADLRQDAETWRLGGGQILHYASKAALQQLEINPGAFD